MVAIAGVTYPWYNHNFTNIKQFAHWIAARIVPGHFTHSFDGLGKWYNHNGCFSYSKETFITLKDRRYFGYGTRPVGRVIGHQNDGQDFYVIEMETDVVDNWKEKDFDEYRRTGIIKSMPARKKEVQKHFKWNIEHHFVRIPVS